MVVLKDTDILMLLIYSHSTCAISKECVLKYGKNSYANVGTIRKHFGNTVSRNILQYYAILGCDKFSFFYIDEKINTCQKSSEKIKLLGLTEYSDENKYLSNPNIEGFLTLIQTIPYGGSFYKSFLITVMSIYYNKKTKVPWHYLLIVTLLLVFFFEPIISITITFTGFKKICQQIFLKIMGSSLIVNLMLLGKCGLRKISSRDR